MPDWLDGALKKSVSPDPGNRYHELSEFLYELRNPNKALIFEDQRPLIERHPIRFWQGLSGLFAVAIVILVVALLA